VVESGTKKEKRRRWVGGYVRGGVYVIERWLRGTRYHVSTHARTERGALEQLRRFEADPAGYDPRGVAALEPVVLTADLIAAHVAYHREEKQNSPGHLRSLTTYLGEWMVALDGADLRATRAARLKELLRDWSTARRYRALAIKGLYRWLRTELELLSYDQDAGLNLKIPKAKPARLFQERAVSRERVERAVAHLAPGAVLDVVRLVSATGLHRSEVARFCRSGTLSKPSPQQEAEGVLANLSVLHKSGELHNLPVYEAEVLEAARRLQARGGLGSPFRLNEAIAKACHAAGVEPWTLGVLRHSVATWLALEGVPLAQIAELLGHRSTQTTRKFYRDMGHHAVPLQVPRLRLVKG